MAGTIPARVLGVDYPPGNGPAADRRLSGDQGRPIRAATKESGMGGEDGKWGMPRYTQIKTA
jgi:hypothetical protein